MYVKKQCSPEYIAHLKSDYWKWVRHKVLERDNYACIVCGSVDSFDDNTDNGVHHIRSKYRFREAGHLETLCTLCPECHYGKVHAYYNAKDYIKLGIDVEKNKAIMQELQPFINRYWETVERRGLG